MPNPKAASCLFTPPASLVTRHEKSPTDLAGLCSSNCCGCYATLQFRRRCPTTRPMPSNDQMATVEGSGTIVSTLRLAVQANEFSRRMGGSITAKS